MSVGKTRPRGENGNEVPRRNRPQTRDRRHFLPIVTNTFDRVFISLICFVAIQLLWMRFLEAYIPLYVAAALSVVLGFFIITRG